MFVRLLLQIELFELIVVEQLFEMLFEKNWHLLRSDYQPHFGQSQKQLIGQLEQKQMDCSLCLWLLIEQTVRTADYLQAGSLQLAVDWLGQSVSLKQCQFVGLFVIGFENYFEQLIENQFHLRQQFGQLIEYLLSQNFLMVYLQKWIQQQSSLALELRLTGYQMVFDQLQFEFGGELISYLPNKQLKFFECQLLKQQYYSTGWHFQTQIRANFEIVDCNKSQQDSALSNKYRFHLRTKDNI